MMLRQPLMMTIEKSVLYWNTSSLKNQLLNYNGNSHKKLTSSIVAQASSWFALRKTTQCVRSAPHHQPTLHPKSSDPPGDVKKTPSGGINTTSRRSGDQPDRSALFQLALSGAISHSRAGFAEEPRGEWTTVLDPSGDERKARSGKARSLRHFLNIKYTAPTMHSPAQRKFQRRGSFM